MKEPAVHITFTKEEFIALSVLKAQKQVTWKDILLVGAKALEGK